MVQGTLTADFNKFSAMTVLDRQNLEKILEEQKLSAGENFSDSDFLRIGNLTSTHYILTGSLTRTASALFILELSIVDAETGERKASYPPTNCTLAELQNMSAVKPASFELLKQMGVALTPQGEKALFAAPNQSTIKAEIALSKGINAEKSGASAKTKVETLYYFYEAQMFDPTLTEASERAAAALIEMEMPLPPSIEQTALSTGNIGEDARNELARYKAEQDYQMRLQEQKEIYLEALLQKQEELISYLEACEYFYNDHPPFELYYDPDLERTAIDYTLETVDLSFTLTTVPVPQSMKTMKAIIEGLDGVDAAINEAGAAGYSWYAASWEDGLGRTFDIEAELINENGAVISGTSITLINPLPDDIVLMPGSVYGSAVFSRVKIGDITDTLTIRIKDINGIGTDASDDTNYIRIAALNFTGNNGYSIEGYNLNGYDKNGYDRFGYKLNGRDKNGYNRLGYNKQGYDKNGYDAQGYTLAQRNKAKFLEWAFQKASTKAYGGYTYSHETRLGMTAGGFNNWGGYGGFGVGFLDGFNFSLFGGLHRRILGSIYATTGVCFGFGESVSTVGGQFGLLIVLGWVYLSGNCRVPFYGTYKNWASFDVSIGGVGNYGRSSRYKSGY
jgi:hypothetical protein